MATIAEKLANSLEELERLQAAGQIAIKSSDLSRTHRERLVQAGFLTEVMKGWLIPSRPDEHPGESTAWYASYWDFCSQYLEARFGENWSLSPEQSLILHAGNKSVPKQLLVRAPGGRNKHTSFPHGTSIFESRATTAGGDNLSIQDGLRLFTLENALIGVQTSFFEQHPTEARMVLAIIPDASGLLAQLLDGGHTRIAGQVRSPHVHRIRLK